MFAYKEFQLWAIKSVPLDFLRGTTWGREYTGINSIGNNFSAQYDNNLFDMTKYVTRSKCEGTTLYRIAQWTSHHHPFAFASSHWRRKCENASGFLVTHIKTCTETCTIQYYLFIIFWIWLSVLILIDYWILSSTVLKIGLWYKGLSISQYVGKWLMHFFIIIIALKKKNLNLSSRATPWLLTNLRLKTWFPEYIHVLHKII